MEHWLTGTIPGIIILGAAGSILALGILWIFRLVPLPLRWHNGRRSKQAYMLGYSAACMERDDTGKRLTVFLLFHVCLLVVFTTCFLFCGIVFLVIVASQSQVALTWGAFISSASAFTLVYLAYFEFEFVYRTYLFYWKGPLEHARRSYFDKDGSEPSAPSGNEELGAPTL